MKQLLDEIENLKQELNGKNLLKQGELERVANEFLVNFTYNSNAIEGNSLTLRETAIVIEGNTIAGKPLKDHLEVIGHRDAFLFVKDLVKDKIPFSENIIKDIHSLILIDKQHDKGKYRRIPVTILGTSHEPPQPYLIDSQMEQLLCKFSSKDTHNIEDIARFHLAFENIHPFIDGNGRTGRIIINFMLMQNNYPPIDIKFANRTQYYKCFDDYHTNNDTKPMTLLLANEVKMSLEKSLSYYGLESKKQTLNKTKTIKKTNERGR